MPGTTIVLKCSIDGQRAQDFGIEAFPVGNFVQNVLCKSIFCNLQPFEGKLWLAHGIKQFSNARFLWRQLRKTAVFHPFYGLAQADVHTCGAEVRTA